MTTMASQITSLTVVYSIVYSGADQRKHQSSASLAFVWGIHRWPVNSPVTGETRKMFPFDDVIMIRPTLIPWDPWCRSWCNTSLWWFAVTFLDCKCPIHSFIDIQKQFEFPHTEMDVLFSPRDTTMLQQWHLWRQNGVHKECPKQPVSRSVGATSFKQTYW